MTVLKNTAIAIGIILILAVLKTLLDKLSPLTSAYHDLLIFDFQLAVFSWITLVILLKPVFKNRVKPTYIAYALIISILALDGLFYAIITHPSSIPTFCRKTFKDYYTSYQRNILQYETCAEYDTAFFYRLKPHTSFSFQNIEFNNQFSTNSLGMRDDDASLNRPQIAFLGDSYTIGWGVDQQQTFTSLTRRKTGMRTLNAAMSSYGTAREIKWLSKIDTSALEYVVVQYCKNDIGENEVYNEHNFLPISPGRTYQDALVTYAWKRKYFPGKYAITLLYTFTKSTLRHLIKGDSIPYYSSNDPVASADQFVKVLNNIPINIQKTKILLIDLNDFNELNNQFLSSVDSLLHTPTYSRLQTGVQTVDLSTILTAGDFYTLDAHLKPSGHAKIAQVLSQYIK
jgi:hypothetical protein